MNINPDSGVFSICLNCAFIIGRYRESDLVKLDIQINGELVEPLSTIVHKDKVI